MGLMFGHIYIPDGNIIIINGNCNSNFTHVLKQILQISVVLDFLNLT